MSLKGTWNVVLELPSGNREARMEIAEDGDALQGELVTETGPQQFSGSVEDSAITLTITQMTPSGPMPLVFDGILDGDQIAGNVELGETGQGGTFVANRIV